MNKYVIGAIALVVLGLGFMSLSSNQTSESVSEVASVSNSKLKVVEPPYDFGDIEIFDGKVNTTYTLQNEGTEAVTITKAETSCMCTEGEIAGLTFGMHGSEVESVVIPAGGEEVVTATYDPLAHGPNGTGPITRTLKLETNSTVTPEVEMRFKANVIKTKDSE